jgi:hypothetical protein
MLPSKQREIDREREPGPQIYNVIKICTTFLELRDDCEAHAQACLTPIHYATLFTLEVSVQLMLCLLFFSMFEIHAIYSRSVLSKPIVSPILCPGIVCSFIKI